MGINTYTIIYILTNIFGIYIIYRFMDVFFDQREADRKIEFLSYSLYFILNTLIYFLINIPIVVMIFNIAAFMGLSLNYKATMKKRILAVTLIYLILMCVEIIVILLLSGIGFNVTSKNEYSLSYSLIVLKVVSYLVVILLKKYKNVKEGETVPFAYWICIFLIPSSSLYIILLLFQVQGISLDQMILGTFFMLLINFLTFYLYDVISATLRDKLDKALLTQQNKYYERQFNLMDSSIKATKSINHDLKNHLSVIYSLVEKGKREESLKHISQMAHVFNSPKTYVYSGNMDIDSILSFKLQEAQQKNIKTSINLKVPEKMNIPSFHMAILLGNLLDNAIAAAAILGEKGYIDFHMKYDKGRLIIKIDNPYKGEILKEGDRYITTKEDKDNHGIGLESIEKVLEKYHGSIAIEHEENIFSVTLLMYIEGLEQEVK